MKKCVNFLVLTFFFSSITIFISAVCASENKYNWKLATLAPDGVGWASYVKKDVFGMIKRLTNGDLNIDVYWGGTMGDDEDYISKMRIGQLDGAGLSGAGALMACPEMAVLALPFLFNNYEEVDLIRNKMRSRFSALCEKNGYKMLIWGDQDFDQIYSTKVELRNPENFKACKPYYWMGEIEASVLKKMGASPIPINVPDAVTSLRSGVTNVGMGPAIWFAGAQLYTIFKYVNPLKIRYMPILIAIKIEAWNNLPENYRTLIDKAILEKTENEFNQYARQSNKQCYDAMVKYGVKETILTEAETSKFKELTRPVWNEFAGKDYPKDVLDEIVGILSEFRASKK